MLSLAARPTPGRIESGSRHCGLIDGRLRADQGLHDQQSRTRALTRRALLDALKVCDRAGRAGERECGEALPEARATGGQRRSPPIGST
jgi:hypothetical protein